MTNNQPQQFNENHDPANFIKGLKAFDPNLEERPVRRPLSPQLKDSPYSVDLAERYAAFRQKQGYSPVAPLFTRIERRRHTIDLTEQTWSTLKQIAGELGLVSEAQGIPNVTALLEAIGHNLLNVIPNYDKESSNEL